MSDISRNLNLLDRALSRLNGSPASAAGKESSTNAAELLPSSDAPQKADPDQNPERAASVKTDSFQNAMENARTRTARASDPKSELDRYSEPEEKTR
jgi:hypothetical protein